LINYRYTDFNEINGVKIGQFQSLRKFVRKHESYTKEYAMFKSYLNVYLILLYIVKKYLI
jgi:hypothetical protein